MNSRETFKSANILQKGFIAAPQPAQTGNAAGCGFKAPLVAGLIPDQAQ